MNHFIILIDGIKINGVFYMDTDSLYFEKKHWDSFNKAGHVGEELGQGKNDYGKRGRFHALFLALKVENCLKNNENGVMRGKKTFRGI